MIVTRLSTYILNRGRDKMAKKYRTGRTAPMINLTAILREMLNEYGQEVRKDAANVLNDLAPEIVAEVSYRSPVGSGREHYAEGWDTDKTTDVFGFSKVIVYNSEKPSLTHLLEFGHRGYPMKNGGRTRDVKGIPHIEPTAKWAEKEAMVRLERKIKG